MRTNRILNKVKFFAVVAVLTIVSITGVQAQRRQIIERNKDGQQTRLQIVDGKIIELYVNGQQIPESRYGEYQHVIDELRSTKAPTPPTPPNAPDAPHAGHEANMAKHEANMRKHEADMAKHEADMKKHDASMKAHDNMVKALEQELAKDGFVKNGSYEFRLTANELYVNTEKQPQQVFEKYMNLFSTHTGKTLKDNQTVHINKR